MDSLKLIGLRVPKMSPMVQMQVPLWLALILKKQARCKIVMPSWLEEEHLRQVYERETTVQDRFSDQLPWRWMELSQSLLAHASDDLKSPLAKVRSLLQDIREVRLAKARAGISELNESHVQMDNLGHMEINELRPFAILVMDQLRRITSLTEPEPDHDDDDYDNDDV
ncbi:Psf2p [Sugiyamaella lignohabitans]|uniref:DNA replication complex GINS protein PSF2 n=1 Tax=Sugiyamaella lignohabitans TaxID=796027 RepID=A0A167F8D1_9ASCO|nr:Psf2p [Sugiyamaella lignohabitans]ANB14948.1 Psf2p [Sugiyamaella lignohabitans]